MKTIIYVVGKADMQHREDLMTGQTPDLLKIKAHPFVKVLAIEDLVSKLNHGEVDPHGIYALEQKKPDTGWMETHFEIVTAISATRDLEGSAAHLAHEAQGTSGLYELAEQLTDEFESRYAGRAWAGDYFDEIHRFLLEKGVLAAPSVLPPKDDIVKILDIRRADIQPTAYVFLLSRAIGWMDLVLDENIYDLERMYLELPGQSRAPDVFTVVQPELERLYNLMLRRDCSYIRIIETAGAILTGI